MSIPTPPGIDDSKIQTQKKCQRQQHQRLPSCHAKHNNNLSFSYRMLFSYRTDDQHPQAPKPPKLSSLNNSRLSSLTQELQHKDETLSEINFLLQKKQKVLETIENKIGETATLERLKLRNHPLCQNKKTIKAPNLFQMQR
jgi:hypothetical protein